MELSAGLWHGRLSVRSQVLGLLQIVTDHQTHVVTAALSHEDQSSLRLMTLRDLTLSGRDMCTQLISALIGRYLQVSGTLGRGSLRAQSVLGNSTED